MNSGSPVDSDTDSGVDSGSLIDPDWDSNMDSGCSIDPDLVFCMVVLSLVVLLFFSFLAFL